MKLSMQFICFCGLLPVYAMAQPVSVEASGSLRVGALMPTFSGVSEKGIEIGPALPQGKFLVHFISDTLPSTCVDDECGPVGMRIAERGGHLIGGCDNKIAKLFGVKLVSGRPWRFDRSLAVIVSDKGQIRGIFENVKIEDIDSLVSRFSY